MPKLIKIVYVGNKPVAYDNVAGSGKCWHGRGAVHDVTEAQARHLLKYRDQWDVVCQADADVLKAPVTVEVTGEDGELQQVDIAGLNKPVERMSKAELVAYAKAKYGKDLDATKGKKILIDTVEEFDKGLDPVGVIS